MHGKKICRRACLAVATTALAIQVCACGGNGTAAVSPTSTRIGLVSIVSNHLQRDGAAWVPHGYFQVAFEAPPAVKALTYEVNATQDYTPQEYTDMMNAKADSVRLMLAQTAGDADPQNPDYADYSAALTQQFVGAVQAARNAGLTVIMGIQDEAVTGELHPLYLPSAATDRVWSQLFQFAPQFKTDKGILLELFNEPGPGPSQIPTTTDWANWAAAMNATIASVRSEGATNVVIADGLAHAETLTGAPSLTDPLNQLAYAAHPYAFQESDEQPGFWNTSFGNFAATNPVIITEWGQGYYCAADNATTLVKFLNYLQTRGIGLEMGAWDWGAASSYGTARYNFPNAQFSSFYTNGVFNTCGTPARGPGLTVNAWYATGVIPGTAL